MIILGLGSNVGDRLAYLEEAINSLSESVLEVSALSPIYESPALLKPGAPKEWDSAFLNMVITGKTNLKPREVLLQVQAIEKKVGRQERGKWAPREIDIDILAYGSISVNEPDLIIPHIALCERAFAMFPFADAAPDWVYPVEGIYVGKTISQIAQKVFPDNIPAKKTGYKLNINI